MIAQFTLVDAGGVAAGRVDLSFDDGATLTGIGVDLLMLARNDPGALSYPPGRDDPGLTGVLLGPLRMLTRGRVVPLAAELQI